MGAIYIRLVHLSGRWRTVGGDIARFQHGHIRAQCPAVVAGQAVTAGQTAVGLGEHLVALHSSPLSISAELVRSVTLRLAAWGLGASTK